MNLFSFSRVAITGIAIVVTLLMQDPATFAQQLTPEEEAQAEATIKLWREEAARAREKLEQEEEARKAPSKPTAAESRGWIDTIFGPNNVDWNSPDRVAKVIYVPVKGYEKFSPELVQRANMVKFYGPLTDLRVLVGEAQRLAVFAIQTCDQATFDQAMKDLDYGLKDLKQMHQQVADITDMNEHQQNYYRQQSDFQLDPGTNPENATFKIAGYQFGVQPYVRPPEQFSGWENWKYEPQATREDRAIKLEENAKELARWNGELQRIDEVIVKSQTAIETNRQKLQEAFKVKACEACGID